LLGSGGVTVSNNQFVGLGGVNNAEIPVRQTIGVGGTITRFYCSVSTSNLLTFTLVLNGIPQLGATCTTIALTGKGSNTVSVVVAPGDQVDVAAPASMPGNTAASFALVYG
jgi:hypothetical protein